MRVFYLLMLLLVSVSSPVSAIAGRADDTLVVAVQQELRSLDRLYTTKREYILLSELTDDGLFYVDPQTLEYLPLAARSYSRIDDKTIDVTLRQGIRFHDGSSLSADDVVYTYRWVIDPASKTKRSRLIASWLDRVEKIDKWTVRFFMKHPYPLAIRDMARGIQIRKNGSYHDKDGHPQPQAQAEGPNGIGPYRVIDFTPGKSVTLERFEDYYEASPKGRPEISRIRFRSIPDWSAQQAEMLSDGVQWMYNVPTDIAVNLGATGLVRHVVGPSMRIGFIPLDVKGLSGPNSPFRDVRVRRAMIHAIDREKIVRYLVQGDARVIHSACHPAQFGCEQDVSTYPYDPQKARDLLKEAGYENGISFELWAYRERQVAEAISSFLAEVGIDAKLRYVKLPTLNLARKKHQVAAYFGTWASGGTADAAAIASLHWSLASDRNFAKDEKLATLVLAAERTLDANERKRIYSKVMRRIAEQAYWVPLYAFTLNYLTSNNLVFPVPRDGLPRLHQARWLKEAKQ